MNPSPQQRITGRAFTLGLLFTVLFAILTVYFGNRRGIYITASQIPVLPYVLLLLMVVLINPLCRLVRFIRPFTVAETLVVFTMGLVSAGVSTFGMADQLIPVVGSLFNRHWNNDQTEWNRYVEPFVNESYFVSAPGIQEKAAAFQKAIAQADATQALFDGADRVRRATEKVAALRGALAAAEALPAGSERDIALATARRELASGEQAAAQAEEAWRKIKPADAPADAAAHFLDRLVQERRAVEERRAELAALESEAQAKVDVFRRGLPPALRAFPGFLPVSGEDDMASYMARLRRLVTGRKALSSLRSAMAVLKNEKAGEPPSAEAREKVATDVTRITNLLATVSDPAPFERHRSAVTAEEAANTATLQKTEKEIVRLSEEKRVAMGSEIKSIEARIADLDASRKRLKKEAARLKGRLEMASRHLEVTRNVGLLLTDLEAVRNGLATAPADTSREALKAIRLRFPAIDATFARYILGDVPWSDWAGPLWRWGALILLSYLMLLTFNVLIFRQWAYNEKLIYPLAELPELLAGHKDENPGWVPEVFRSGLFWVGFAVSGFTLGWNILCMSGAVPGLTKLELDGKWTAYIGNTPLQGLLPSAKSAIFFTMIGLTFLIPTKVSFSLWFFSVLYMAQLLLMVSMNLGVNEKSFPEEWWYTFSFRTAEGGGALIVFASVVLWKCRRYLLCAFMPDVTKDLESDERKELRFSSVLFLASLAGITLILWKGMGASLWHTLFALFIILVITIGLVRAVTEGGILGFQAWVSPFHFIRSFTGMAKTATAPSLFAPLMVFYSVLFLDIKAFIAPAFANSLKVRDDLRLSRARFHAIMAVAVVSAMVVAGLVSIMLAYSKGADTDMSGWFYTNFPKSLFEKIATMTKTPPLPASNEAGWVLFGGGVMALLLYLRQSLFWLPHPIGLIMLVNPIMRYYWFSIFIGWAAKAIVTRYGGKSTYVRMRGLFIGLIAGELLMVTLSMVLSVLLDMPIRLDLNRNP